MIGTPIPKNVLISIRSVYQRTIPYNRRGSKSRLQNRDARTDRSRSNSIRPVINTNNNGRAPDIVLALLKQPKSVLRLAEAEHYFIASSQCGPYFTYAYRPATRNLTHDERHVTRQCRDAGYGTFAWGPLGLQI